jgi:hypothetical protein
MGFGTCAAEIDAAAPETVELDPVQAPIDTRRVTGRRMVRYANFDEFLADAEVAAGGPVRQLGNWTVAEIFDHLARSMNVSVEGTDEQFPWALRIALRPLRKRIIANPMKPGYRVPENVAILLRPESHIGLRESLWKLRSAASRFESAVSFPPHPAFGLLTRDEYRSLALRHAELHMSFVQPIQPGNMGIETGLPVL